MGFRNISQSQIFSRRAFLVTTLEAGLLCGLTGRLVYLQVIQSDRYKLLAEENRINTRLLPPIRGRIYDRNGVELAGNRQTYRAILIPEETEDVEKTLENLNKLIVLEKHTTSRLFDLLDKQEKFIPVEIRDNLDWAEVSRIEANGFNLPGIHINTDQSRIYHYGSLFLHSLGYVSAPSGEEVSRSRLFKLPNFKIGKRGIEKSYEDSLRGRGGISRIEINAGGRVIKEIERDVPSPGDNLWLAADFEVQAFVNKLLEPYRRSAAVVMNARSGEILASVSRPSFDPNALTQGLNEEEWKNLSTHPDTPLTDRAFNGLYAPGSTFKMIVMLAALENGIPPSTNFLCGGSLAFGRRRFHCWKRRGHGDLDMIEALRSSCDVWFYNVSQLLGVDLIARYAKILGVGVDPNIDIKNVRSGLLPTKMWKLDRYKEPWFPGETLIVAIGQGYLLMTPLQLCMMIARLASGYQVTPRMRVSEKDVATQIQSGFSPFEKLPVKEENLNIIRQAMGKVVNDPKGTAYRVRIDNPLYMMAGKTGTSQVRRIGKKERKTGIIKNKDLEWEKRDHALFVGYAPIENPEWTVSIIIEHGGSGSSVAGPIARDILLYIQKRYQKKETTFEQTARL